MKKPTRFLASIALLASACNSGTKQNGGQGAEPQDADVAQAPAVSAAASPEGFDGDLAWKTISAGGGHTCALDTDGIAFCWGQNRAGQLGDGTTAERSVPTPVARGITFTSISSGGQHTCAVAVDGAAYCWGSNENGALGSGATEPRVSTVPLRVAGGLRFISVSAGQSGCESEHDDRRVARQCGGHSCGVTSGGAAYCWGSNFGGILGSQKTVQSPTPVRVAGDFQFAVVRAGARHACGVTTADTVVCWGQNGWGSLGRGTRDTHPAPAPVAGSQRFASLSVGGHSCGVTMTASVYCWGGNLYGQLGDSAEFNVTPVPVLATLNLRSVSVGRGHTCGWTTAGVAFCGGENSRGTLGNGTTTSTIDRWRRPSRHSAVLPVRRPRLALADSTELRFVEVSAGDGHSCGVVLNGAAYCWGANEAGQLGNGRRNNSIRPTRVLDISVPR